MIIFVITIFNCTKYGKKRIYFVRRSLRYEYFGVDSIFFLNHPFFLSILDFFFNTRFKLGIFFSNYPKSCVYKCTFKALPYEKQFCAILVETAVHRSYKFKQ